jgi:hypothetical protein
LGSHGPSHQIALEKSGEYDAILMDGQKLTDDETVLRGAAERARSYPMMAAMLEASAETMRKLDQVGALGLSPKGPKTSEERERRTWTSAGQWEADPRLLVSRQVSQQYA